VGRSPRHERPATPTSWAGRFKFADPFAITAERHGAISLLKVSGELDLATAPQFREAHARARQGEPDVLLIDLADVTFIDSTGLDALLDAHVEDEEQRLRIILGPATAYLIDLARLRDRLPIIEG
jgi:anti-anti-sigma factor